MKARLISLLLAASMLLGLAACGKSETEEAEASRSAKNEMIVGIAQDLGDSLNPYQMSSAGTKEIMTNVFEGLYKVTPSGDYAPAVAESYTLSDDGCTYTFKLRSGVKFHNGKEVDLDDILYSFTTCQETALDSTLPKKLEGAVFTKDGEDSFKIQLPAANNDFIAYVALVYIIPKDYTEIDTNPVGTGPFKFVSRSVQENLIFEKFADYWGEPAKLDLVTCKIYEDTTALVTALNAGSIDMVAHLTLDQVTGLGDAYNIIEGTMNLVQALYLNNARAPFDDVRVRKAVCYALDVDEILAITAEGHGSKLGSSIYPAFGKYFDKSLVDMYPCDTEKAKALLAEAGYPDGISFSITVPSNYTPHVNTAQVMVMQLEKAGIHAELKEVEWNTWLTDVYQGRDFDSTVCGFDASTLTADALLSRYVSSNAKNMISFNNAEYDETMAAASAETDDAKRTELYLKAERILAEEAANAYTQDLAEFLVLNSKLAGFNFYPLYRLDFSTIYYR